MSNLYYRVLGEGEPIVILHGVFGSSDNWLTVGKQLANTWKVFLVDQRNHGQSFHNDHHDYEVMSEDLKQFLEGNSLQGINLVGHSMGGKVAMTFALDNPEYIKRLVVVDIAPKQYPVHHSAILQGLSSIDLGSLQSRSDADAQLAAYVPEIGVRQFLLKNLSRGPEGFRWKLNLSAISGQIEKLGEAPGSEMQFAGTSLFIRGATSDYVEDEDKNLILDQFPNSQLVTIENAGHWVHAEQPEIFLRHLVEFLNN